MLRNFVDIYTGEILQLAKLPVKFHNGYSHEKYLRSKYAKWVNSLGFEKFGRTVYFLTLTYNDANYDGFPHYNHLQNFVKRIRRYMDYHNLVTSDGLPLKYFFCVERGKRTDRLHYHGLVYGLPSQIVHILRNGVNAPNSRNIWNYGFAQAKRAINRNVTYVCKYMFKQSDGIEYKTIKNGNIGMSIMAAKNKSLVQYFRRNFVTTFNVGEKHPYRMTKKIKEGVFCRKTYDTLVNCFAAFDKIRLDKILQYDLWTKFKDMCVTNLPLDCTSHGSYVDCGHDGEVTLVSLIPDWYYNILNN